MLETGVFDYSGITFFELLQNTEKLEMKQHRMAESDDIL